MAVRTYGRRGSPTTKGCSIGSLELAIVAVRVVILRAGAVTTAEVGWSH